MKFTVDVKLFTNVTVEAEDRAAARKLADEFVQTLDPSIEYIGGYNLEQELQKLPGRIVEVSGIDIDGESYVDGVTDEEAAA